MKADPLIFWKKYNLIASTGLYSLLPVKAKKCRFCGKKESQTSFEIVSHVLPELLGENDVISNDECDNCNRIFSGFESNLSIFFRPYLTVVGVKGKHKIPNFQSRSINSNEDTRTLFRYDKEGVRQLIIGDIEDYVIDNENNRFHLKFRLPPYRPQYVYKALLKIGLSILPSSKKAKYQNLFGLLMDGPIKSKFIGQMFFTVLLSKKFAKPFAELYEAKRVFTNNAFIPELTLIVNFGNIVAQIYLPLSKKFNYAKSNGKNVELHLYPAFLFNTDAEKAKLENKLDFNFTSVDLSPTDTIVHDQTLNFTFNRTS